MWRKIRKKKSSAVPLFRSGHMSAICARPSKGKGEKIRGWKTAGCLSSCAPAGQASSVRLAGEIPSKKKSQKNKKF